ncbi:MULTISPECIES: type VII secretion protein EssB [Bacillus]|uniref:ESAT-6 secretion machinery protein EssB n=1 Tax=Bacillus paralicheniformis TaxID=1648923 RepID=A0ABY3G106_9BACI|nr:MULTISPECIES: type VII secretion protein EssB [Bacillus]MCY1628617.1 type VII secretion protein EssB [Bacillus paralicheniformis]MEB3127558.1 type VII secretion protein EssB [Bacillus paralicheniformis]MEC4199541.1 type VII secretion protein EssB [Bacillus sp. AAVF1]MED1146338.1 type VII secretion protein EssB [Bacillus paralicheniformis]MED1151139.1 type VII secretion protein EssB [Bacillus paralicheniformis]
MAEKKKTYLEDQLEAVMTKEDGSYIFRFQREKINLVNGLEANVIKEVDPSFNKETVMTDDEVQILIQPPSEYKEFRYIKGKNKKSKWLFAYQLVKAVEEHSIKRLHLIAAPENIVFDKGLTPKFLHYGVKESIPPYEHDEERLFNEVKAAAALAVDGQFTFEEYLKYSETIKFSDQVKDIITSGTYGDLKAVIQKKIDELDAEEKTLVHLPKKKWKIQRYIGLGLILCLIPAVLFSFYSLFFAQPKQQAFIESNRYFLNKQYSKVISTLDKYDAGEMPDSVQYQLAYSYVLVESALKELDWQEDALKSLTLQVDPNNFLYWIQIGRGDNKGALETGRKLENDLQIIYAITKYMSEIKADDQMSSDEREKLLEPLQKEFDELYKTLEQNKKEQKNTDENQQANTEQSQADVEAAKAEKEKAEQEQAKKENKEKEDKKKKDDK